MILLDCCPSLGMLTINSLAAADKVLIPMQAHYPSITMANMQATYPRGIIEILHKAYDTRLWIFSSITPLSIRAAETSMEGRSICLHDPTGKVFATYTALTREGLV